MNGLLASRSDRKHASKQARKHARKQARNPSELVPSVASLREATPPHGEAVGRSSRALHVEIARSGTPELRNSSLTERSEVGESCSGTPP